MWFNLEGSKFSKNPQGMSTAVFGEGLWSHSLRGVSKGSTYEFFCNTLYKEATVAVAVVDEEQNYVQEFLRDFLEFRKNLTH